MTLYATWEWGRLPSRVRELVAESVGGRRQGYAETSHDGWVGGSHWLGVGNFIGGIVRGMGMSARYFCF